MKNFFNNALFIFFQLSFVFILIIIIKPGASIFFFHQPIPPDLITNETDTLYHYSIRNNSSFFQINRAIVLENNSLLRKIEYFDADQPNQKGVYYLFGPTSKGYQLYFSPSDSSNPKINNKNYSVGFPIVFLSRTFGVIYLVIWFIGFIEFLVYIGNSPKKRILLHKPFYIFTIWGIFVESKPLVSLVNFYKNIRDQKDSFHSISKKLYIGLVFFSVIISIIMRLHMMMVEKGQADEYIYLDTAVKYANALNKGDFGNIIYSETNYEHPIFNKLVFGATLYVLHPFYSNNDLLRPVKGFEGFPLAPRVQILRLVSVFFGTMEVLLLSIIHPLAGLLLSIHTFAVRFTSVIYLESIGMAFSLLSVWYFDKAIQNELLKKQSYKWFFASSLCLGIATASKYIFATTGIACLFFGLLWFIKKNRLQKFKCLLYWFVLAILFFILFDPYLWPNPLSRLIQSLQYSQNYSNGEHVSSFSFPFWQPIYWLTRSFSEHGLTAQGLYLNEYGDLIKMDSLIFISALIGLPCLFKKRPLFFYWLIFSLLFLLFWKTKWPQYVGILLAPLCLSSMYGFIWIWNLIKNTFS